MPERYSGAFDQIERNFKKQIRNAQDPTDSQFRELVLTVSAWPVNVNDALRLLQVYYNEYKRQKRAGAVRYCVFEMERLLKASEHRDLQMMYPQIEFDTPVKEELREFISKKRPVYETLFQILYNRWLITVTMLVLILLALIVLLFHGPFMGWFLFMTVCWFILVWYGKHKEVPHMIQIRMEQSYKELDQAHSVLIRRWDIQNPAYFKGMILRYWRFQDRRKEKKEARRQRKRQKKAQ